MLSRYERETQINYNEEEPTATVYTHNNRMKRRLAQLSSKSPNCCLIKSTEEYDEYIIPKSWVKISMPRQLSEEQRAEFAKRAKANLKKWKEKYNA